MKKFCLFLSFILIFPFSVLAEENINNGELSSPIGTVSVYAGIESDTQLLNRGYLIANGASILRADYPELFAIIGTTYGSSDSNHFNLPDLRGRTVVGVYGSNDQNKEAEFDTLGETGGAKTVTLTVNQIPSHTHTFTGTSSTTASSGAHTHTFSGTTSANGYHTHTLGAPQNGSGTWSGWTFNIVAISASASNALAVSYEGNHTHTYSGTTSGASANHTHTVTPTGTNANTGGGQAHNNLQPYIALKYIIKVK